MRVQTSQKKAACRLFAAMIGFAFLIPAARADVIYFNDFSSSPPILTHTVNGEFQVGSGLAGDQNVSGSYSYNSTRTRNMAPAASPTTDQGGGTGVSDGVFALRYNNAGVLWLVLDTQTWVAGDYSLSFDAINFDRPGNLIVYDIFGGSGLDAFDGSSAGTDYLEVRTASSPSQVAVRNLIGNATAEALDPLRTALDSTSDNTITSVANSISFTLSDDHVGTAGDYFLVGWTNSSGDDWELDNVLIESSSVAVPEPGGFAILTIGALGLCIVRRRQLSSHGEGAGAN